MVLEIIGKSLKGIAENLGFEQKSRVDKAVQDFKRLQRITRVLRTETPFTPEDVAQIAREKKAFTEEETEEYLSRLTQGKEK